MPGVLGILDLGGDGDPARRLATIAQPMDRGGRLSLESRVEAAEGWALGRSHLGILNPGPQLDGGPPYVLFHGELRNERELRAELSVAGVEVPAGDHAALLRELYRRHGDGFAPRLSGSFCAVVLDPRTDNLLLVTDLLGSHPVYWHLGARTFTFAGELEPVRRSAGDEGRLDPRAVADLLKFGFPLGDKTLAEGVRLLPAASLLRFERRHRRTTIERYRDPWVDRRPFDGTREQFLTELDASFRAAVGRALDGRQHHAVALSGGLDSRAILSAAGDAAERLSTYTLGVRGCADQVIAARLGRIAGTRHTFLELDPGYLGEFLPNLRKMVALTDGMYLTHGLTEMLAYSLLAETGYQLLLRGHGGELAKMRLAWPFHVDDPIAAMSSRSDFVSYLLKRFSYYSDEAALAELFEPGFRELMAGQPRRSLEESLEGRALSPTDCCAYLYLGEHHRRYTVASLELFRNLVEVRMPFCDPAFLELLLSGPPEWRAETAIHKRIIRAGERRLARVRNSNTGAPANAPRWLERALDLPNSALARAGVHGFRHYHDFDRWMTAMLVDSASEVLLDDGSACSGLLRRPALERLLEETRGGATGRAYLLQALMNLELWLKMGAG